MLLQSYQLNVVPDQRIGTVTVNASQYDKESRTIRMTMYNGDVPFQIPADANVYVIGTKADNTGYQYECSYVANTNQVTFDIQPQMTVLPGFHMAEIRVTKDGEILGSANFKFQIERGALSDDTVISDTDLPLVEKAAEAVDALEDVTDAIEEANAILSQIDPIAEAVQANALKSEGFAVGEQDGTPVESGTYYHNNSKYYSEQASTSATNAHISEVNAGDSETNALSYKNSASQSASDALGYKNASSSNATASANEALKSEGFAVGQQNGTDVSSGSPYYHNNAKYFSEQASTSATNAHTSEVNAGLSQSNASGSATNASNSALVSEGFAVGQQNGTDVSSGSPYYENNSKYYSEQAESIKEEMADLLDNVAMQDGYYESLTAGNLTTNISETDKEPYNFRTSGGSLDIGAYEDDTIIGGSLGWNQLIAKDNIRETRTVRGVTFTNNGDGSVTLSGTGESDGTAGEWNVIQYDQSHRYLYTIVNNQGKLDYDNNKYNVEQGNIYIKTGVAYNVTFFPQAFDLTQMFGSTIAEYLATLPFSNIVAFFKKYFPKDYYSYNAGTLESVKTSKHEMVGFNQWDEEWELGAYSPTTGEKDPNPNAYRSTNYIPIFPNTTYYFYGNFTTTGSQARVFWYDADKNYISVSQGWNTTITSPLNAHFCTFRIEGTHANDTIICINLHWDGVRDGEYEPYVNHSYDLDPITLNGVFKLDSNNNLYAEGDIYKSVGEVTRKYDVVDLGDLDWRYVTTSDRNYFRTENAIANIKIDGERICAKYEFIGNKYDSQMESVPDKTIANAIGYPYVQVKDSAYTDATTFKTAMSGVYLAYELETPTTESADPFENPQWVDNWGTEEYVDYGVSQNTRDVSIPVGHETIYPVDLKAKLETSPDVPSGDGLYLLKQESGENSYQQYVSPIPSVPSENGNYVLKCSVSGGVVTMTWESAS